MANELKCEPLITGTLWNIGQLGFRNGKENYLWPSERWLSELDAIKRAGIDTIILNGTYYTKVQRNNNLPAYTKGDLLLFLFHESAKRNIKLILETYVSSPLWEHESCITEDIKNNYDFIKYLNEKYGRFENFHAWYIGYETCIRTGKQEQIVRNMYRQLTAMCHDQSPQRPVMISPFYMLDSKRITGPVEFYSPQFYTQWWGETLQETQIDILALQDSGAEHVAGTSIEARRPFFKAMQEACLNAGTHFWGNVETAEIKVESFEEYAEKFGWGTWVNEPVTRDYWKAVEIEKLKDKLQLAATYCEKIITWGYREFYQPSFSSEAARHYNAYIDYLDDQYKQNNTFSRKTQGALAV